MRFLRWFKQIPLVVLIGLIGAWVLSVFYTVNYHSVHGLLGIGNGGMIAWSFDNSEIGAALPDWHVEPAPSGWRVPLGQCDYHLEPAASWKHWNKPEGVLYIPISGLVTLLMPLVVGVWTRFRFRLWMYFAWTALVAAQCAYFVTLVRCEALILG